MSSTLGRYFSKKRYYKIPKRNLLAEEKTNLGDEAIKLKPLVDDIIEDRRIELNMPPGIWYGYKDEWLAYAAAANNQVYIKGSLPDCGALLYAVSIPPDRFVNPKHYSDPFKIMKIQSNKDFDRFTKKYIIDKEPKLWLEWEKDPSFEMPLEYYVQGDGTRKVLPQYLDWKRVLHDFAGIEIKPHLPKREGKIKVNGVEVDSWYNIWATAGGVIWRPLNVIRLYPAYERDESNNWIVYDHPNTPPHYPAPMVPQHVIDDPQLAEMGIDGNEVYHSRDQSYLSTTSTISGYSMSSEYDTPLASDDEVEEVNTWPRRRRMAERRPSIMEIQETMMEKLNIPHVPTAPPLPPRTTSLPGYKPSPKTELEPEPKQIEHLEETQDHPVFGSTEHPYSQYMPIEEPKRKNTLPRIEVPPEVIDLSHPDNVDLHENKVTTPKRTKEPKSYDKKHTSWPLFRSSRIKKEAERAKKESKPKPIPSIPVGTWKGGKNKKKRIKVVPTLPKNFMEMLKKGEMPKEWEELGDDNK
jgi:hypothetical protein